MTSDGLRTFIMLSKLKNFTRTAERMFVAQSTVTNRIFKLEKEIGKKLFERRAGGVELTEEGSVFLNYAVRMTELEESFIQEVNSSAKYKKTLKIGAINAVYESALYPVISNFIRKRKDISTKVMLGHSLDMLQMLQDKIIDVAFSYVPLKKAGFACEEFYSDRLALFASPRINEYKNGIRKAELANLDYLLCNFAYGDVGVFILSLFPPRHAFGFEIDNSGKLIRYLTDGFGYSFLPCRLAESEVQAGLLEEVRLIDFATPAIVTYCSYSKTNAAACEFLQTMKEDSQPN